MLVIRYRSQHFYRQLRHPYCISHAALYGPIQAYTRQVCFMNVTYGHVSIHSQPNIEIYLPLASSEFLLQISVAVCRLLAERM
jgi:hypothetical protein